MRKGRNIAISEWPTNSAFQDHGYADYAFFIGEKLVAVMDAKKMSEDVASTIDVQIKDYASHAQLSDPAVRFRNFFPPHGIRLEPSSPDAFQKFLSVFLQPR